tara:strand:+ start:6588 stop:7205 length:618 start_codon:yes stop_codon:yes gene_type:complete
MYKKIFFQSILIALLFFILWYIFYFYLSKDSKIIELSIKNTENSEIYLNSNEESKKEIADSNREVTENLVYKSKDASGNLYLLESKFGRTDEKNKNIILLDKVTAKIKLVDKPEITIKADYAEYDYDSLNTKFFDNVNIKYNTNFITSDNLDLIFNKNIANMYNNVFFNNKTSKAKADLISMNFLTGNINIQMYEKKEKIKINKE